MLREEIETKLNRACLHIYKEGHYEEDYQMPMLRQNKIKGILGVEGCQIEGEARYTYQINGLVSVKSIYEKTSIKKQKIMDLTEAILETTELLQQYMLNPDCLILKPEYIYYGNEEYFFCYFPVPEEIQASFHELTEFFVKRLDYEDTEGIFLAFELHKATMQEHYNLRQIMEDYERHKAERIKNSKECAKQRESRLRIQGKKEKDSVSEKNMVRQKEEAGKYVKKGGIPKEKPKTTRAEIEKRKEKVVKNKIERDRKSKTKAIETENRDWRDAGTGETEGLEWGSREDLKRIENLKQEGKPGIGRIGNIEEKRDDEENIDIEMDGNVFCFTDEEDAYETGQKQTVYEKYEPAQTANFVREESGWRKPWKKAAESIRRKRWGNWEDLILETDGQD